MTRLAPPEGKPGRPEVFSDAEIRFCPTSKGDGRPDIRAVELTPGSDGDSPFVGNPVPRTVFLSSSLPGLLGQSPEGDGFGTVTADAADDRSCAPSPIHDEEAGRDQSAGGAVPSVAALP